VSRNGNGKGDGAGDRPPSRFPRWLFPAAALAVVVLALAAVVLVTGGGDEATIEVGTVHAASGAQVRTSDGADPRALEDGEAVLYGWSVEAGDSPEVTIDLAAGGVLRFDSGATATFTAGDDSGEPRPRVDVTGGRTWFNPAGVSESAALVLRTDVITLSSTRNPVALDCTAGCTAEAPAGGVKVSTEAGAAAAPATDEALTVTSDGGLVVHTIPQPSAWTQQNLDADATSLPPPEPAQLDGVTAGAAPAAAYAFDLAITSDGEGDEIDPSVTFGSGLTAHYEATLDTGPCAQVPCDVPVAATSQRPGGTLNLSGSFHIAGRSMALTMNRQVDCPGAPPARAAGTVTITADMTISEATYDEAAQRWIATVMAGPGTAVAQIGDAGCLGAAGTRSNQIEMTGHAAG
jgi:hypothetical protein